MSTVWDAFDIRVHKILRVRIIIPLRRAGRFHRRSINEQQLLPTLSGLNLNASFSGTYGSRVKQIVHHSRNGQFRRIQAYCLFSVNNETIKKKRATGGVAHYES